MSLGIGIIASQRNRLLLDQYTGAAAAYSLRKLRSGYTGSAIRVRRSSDNTEQDIGFTSAGNLDESALTTFVGANNGFVVTWYDQSGNSKNATQSTAGSQPQIVSSGSILTTNSKPCLTFDGTNDYLNNTQSSTNLFATNYSVFVVHNVTGGSLRKFIIETTNPSSDVYNPAIEYNGTLPTNIRIWSGSGAAGISAISTSSTNIFSSNVQRLITSLKNGTTIQEIFVNNLSEGSSSALIPANNITGYNIGTYRSANDRWFEGTMQELILYSSYQSSNRTGISVNINTYFNIY
jgi:hypothetical protein